MKTLLLSAILFLFYNLNAQTKVETKENEYLHLQTLKYKIHSSDDNTKYYTYTFSSGYEYPTIHEGYYNYGIFHTLEGMITFYTELANLENQENGFYKLSTKVQGKGNIYVEKLSKKVKLYPSLFACEHHLLKYKTFKINDIKADLITLQSLKIN